MADQLVSADPNWAGAPAPPMAHLSAAHADSALPATDDVVTLGDLKADPVAAVRRIGTILKKDVSDPKLWLALAASYFAPKIFDVAAPVVARAANTVGRVQVNPSVAMKEFSLTKPQNLLKAVSLKEQPVAARVPGFDRYMPNTGAAPVAAPAAASPMAAPPAPASRLAETPIDPSMEAIADRLAGGPGKPSKGNGALPTSPGAAAPASTAAPVVDTPPPPPATASPVSPAPVASSRPLQPGQTVDLPMAQRTKGQQSTSWLQSDLGMAARRQGVKLTEAESTAAETLMRDHGVSPTEAVQTVGQLQAARTPSGLTLSPEEATQFAALKQQGQSGAQAEAAILKLRTLAKTLKTPTSQTVTDAVQRRNATGRWDQ